MSQWVQNLMNYPGIVFLMFLENVFPPIPSELVMPLAGYTAGRGQLSLIGVMLAGLIGSLIGQLPLYYLGKWVGEEKLADWANKYGAWLTLSGDEIHKSVEWFNRHGSKAVLLARVVPGVRSLISIPAGITNLSLGKFLLLSAIGTGAWASALAFAGYLLKDQYTAVEKYLGPATYVILGGIFLYIAFSVIKRKRQANDKPQEKTPEAQGATKEA